MADQNKISIEEFYKLVRKGNKLTCKTCNKHDYAGWENPSSNINEKLLTFGVLLGANVYIQKNGYAEYHQDKTNYWSKDAPIALEYYPYHESTIKICTECHAVFLNYIEYSGHAPQNRFRWVQEHLIYPKIN